MLFNLGLTADAAAAHESDLVGPQSPPNPPTRASSPLTALSSLPTLGTIYNKYKGMEPQATQGAALRDMTRSPVESVLSSDGEHSVIDTGFRASRVGRSHSVKKSLRPKTSYQLAHPASHAHHRCFKIRPKLLLQLQQVSHTPRPLPIFDVLPSTVFLPRLARKFPTIFRGKNGLGPNDLIIVTSDLYDADPRDRTSQGDDSDDEEQQEKYASTAVLRGKQHHSLTVPMSLLHVRHRVSKHCAGFRADRRAVAYPLPRVRLCSQNPSDSPLASSTPTHAATQCSLA
jgi:hypothetical protein